MDVDGLNAFGQIGVDGTIPGGCLTRTNSSRCLEDGVPDANAGVEIHAEEAVVLGELPLDDLHADAATRVRRNERVEVLLNGSLVTVQVSNPRLPLESLRPDVAVDAPADAAVAEFGPAPAAARRTQKATSDAGSRQAAVQRRP